jgi:LysM repeat protein
MKKLLTLLCCLPFALLAQKTLKHTVAAKESYSSIGRLYNINGRTLANFNKLDYDKGLSIGQVLNVPVTENTPKVEQPKIVKEIPDTKPIENTNSTAKKHTVGAKETLYGISKKYGVTVADIKKWNNLTTDGLSEGSEIYVSSGTQMVKFTPPVVKPNTEIEKPKKIEETTITNTKVIEEKPVAVVKPIVAEKPKVKEVEVTETDEEAKDFKGGIFKKLYKDDGSVQEGAAGIFKSTSGWEDGKYYCLHNTADAGTIVKITNKANGKSVYAKVLDVMPDLKQNSTLKIRISNAAADVLGVTSASFDCLINY